MTVAFLSVAQSIAPGIREDCDADSGNVELQTVEALRSLGGPDVHQTWACGEALAGCGKPEGGGSRPRSDGLMAPRLWGYAVPKGHPEFIQFLNGVVEQLFKDGRWNATARKWLNGYEDIFNPIIK